MHLARAEYRYDKYYQTPRVWLLGYDEVGAENVSFPTKGLFASGSSVLADALAVSTGVLGLSAEQDATNSRTDLSRYSC